VREGRVIIKISDKGIDVEYDGKFSGFTLCQAVVAFAHSVQEMLQRQGLASKPILEVIKEVKKKG